MNAYDSPPQGGRRRAERERAQAQQVQEVAPAPASGLEATHLEAPTDRAEPGFELGVGVSALAVFGALWALSLVLSPALVAGGGAACTAVGAARVVLRVRDVGRALGWEIRDEGELAVARGAVEADMKGSAILLSRLIAVLVFCLASGVPTIGLSLVLFCVPFGPWASAVEGRFRAMKVHGDGLASRFKRIAEAWKEPRWRLPPDV